MPENDSFWGNLLCDLSGLIGVVFVEVLGLAGEGCGVVVEGLCLESRTVRLVPAGKALSRYL